MERMEGERLTNRADVLRVEGRRRRGRPRLRRERDLTGIGGEWRMRARDGEWRWLVKKKKIDDQHQSHPGLQG